MTGLWQYIHQAGAIGYILLFISIISLTVVIERIIFWLFNGWTINISENKHSALICAFKNKEFENILKEADTLPKIDARAVKYVAYHLKVSDDKPLDIALSREIVATNRWLAILQVNASIAPMLGILGTVIGIIQSFKGMSGATPDTAVMVAGISVSMLTTAIGLIVALSTLIPLNWLANKAHKRQTTLAELLQECWIARGE